MPATWPKCSSPSEGHQEEMGEMVFLVLQGHLVQLVLQVLRDAEGQQVRMREHSIYIWGIGKWYTDNAINLIDSYVSAGPPGPGCCRHHWTMRRCWISKWKCQQLTKHIAVYRLHIPIYCALTNVVLQCAACDCSPPLLTPHRPMCLRWITSDFAKTSQQQQDLVIVSVPILGDYAHYITQNVSNVTIFGIVVT